MIVCSLNEVETYARRAARGAGMVWGLAEEAGKAARWLCERGLPGLELLARLLEANDGRPYEEMAPVITNGRWRAAGAALCPVCTGAALSDHVDRMAAGQSIGLAGVDHPLLLAPFLDRSWRGEELCFELRWPDARLLVSGGGVTIGCERDGAHLSVRAEQVTVTPAAPRSAPPGHRPRVGGIRTPTSAWRVIDTLAGRTYVQATEESRARGAGAGRTDND